MSWDDLYLYLWSHLGPAIFFVLLKRYCRLFCFCKLEGKLSKFSSTCLIEHHKHINDVFPQILLQVCSDYTLKSVLILDTRYWKILPLTCHDWHKEGVGVYLYPLTSVLDGCEWWTPCPGRLIPGKSPSTHCAGGCVGFWVRPDESWEEKIPCHNWGSNPEPSSRKILVETRF
jgi:hypothetical protein